MPMQPVATETQYRPFRWFVLATLLIVTATTALALISPAPLIGEIIKTSPNLSPGQVTWMTMGYFNLFVAMAALGGGVLVDRLGFLKIYIIGVVLIVIGWLLIPVIGSEYMGMTFIRLLQGLGTGPIMASSAAIAATYFPVKERGIVTGVQGAAMSLGIGAGLLVVPKLLVSTGDWQHALSSLWPVGVVALTMTLVVAVGPKAAPIIGDADVSATSLEQKVALKTALLSPMFWAAVGCVVVLSWVFQAFNDLTPGFLALNPPVGLGKGAAGSSLLVAAQGFNVVGALVAGFVTERFFRGRVRPGIVTGFVISAVFGASLLLKTVQSNDGLLILVLCVAAFFYAWINPNALAYIAKNYPKEITGKLGGLTMGIGIIGGTAGVAAGATALHATGTYRLSIIIMCAVGLVGAVVGLTLRQPKSTTHGTSAGPEASGERAVAHTSA